MNDSEILDQIQNLLSGRSASFSDSWFDALGREYDLEVGPSDRAAVRNGKSEEWLRERLKIRRDN